MGPYIDVELGIGSEATFARRFLFTFCKYSELGALTCVTHSKLLCQTRAFITVGASLGKLVDDACLFGGGCAVLDLVSSAPSAIMRKIKKKVRVKRRPNPRNLDTCGSRICMTLRTKQALAPAQPGPKIVAALGAFV